MTQSLGRPNAFRLLALLALPFSAACGAGSNPEHGAVVMDSAGVRIVQNGSPLEQPAWTLAAEPSLTIGTVAGEDAYQLMWVSGAVRLSDGSIVLANSGSSELRFYDRDGIFVRAVGGEGEGPGEFRGLSGIWRIGGDTLVAWDGRLGRVTWFSARGEFVRSARLLDAGANPRMVGLFADGSLLNESLMFEAPEAGIRQQYLELSRHAPNGARLDELGRHPSFRTAPVRWPGGGSAVAAELFGARTSVAAGEDRIAIGTGHEDEVRIHGPSGELVSIVRWRGGDRIVTDEHVRLHRESELAEAEDDDARRREVAYLEQVPVADRFPSLASLRLDRTGALWVQRFNDPTATEAEWWVFDSGGELAARVVVPNDFWIFEIGGDYVLGVARDELDVERLVVYGLTRA